MSTPAPPADPGLDDAAVSPVDDGLLDRYLDLVQHLRAAGLPVSVAESADGARVLTAVPLVDRSVLRTGLAAALAKRASHRPAFDTLFDLWFPPLTGPPPATPTDRPDRPDRPAGAEPGPAAGMPGLPGGAGADPAAASALAGLREELYRLVLADPEPAVDEAIRRLARTAVDRLGRADTQPGRQSWFSYRVLRAMSAETLTARLLDAMLAGQRRGGLAEQVARATVAERLRAFEAHVQVEVRRRVAEDRGADAVSRTAVAPLLEEVAFLSANAADMAALRRQVHPLARRLATRLTARRRRGRTGRLDFRRTVRASLGTGGVPVVTHHRPHRPHKPELVVLCDVSGSVTSFAHFTLMLAYALQDQFTKVRAFAFVDTCDEVTRFFAAGDDVLDAAMRIAREADVVRFDGHSDYGHAFEVLVDRYPDALTPRASVLILGDARTNYRNPGLPALRQVVRQTRHAYWLNPEPRRQWGSADSVAPRYAEVLPMAECRTVGQLEQFVRRLLPT